MSVPLAVAALSACVLAVLLSPSLRSLLPDVPSARSLHRAVVPRTGGLSILAGVLAAVVALESRAWPLTGALLVLGAISLLDDRASLGAPLRLAVHLAAAVAVCVFGLDLPLGWAVLAGVGIAWSANLFNFMDGSDGLAGGMAVIGFAALAVAAQWADQPRLFLLCLAIAASVVPFLLVNFHPARLFMGDSGSISLGFLAATLGLAGWREASWPAWFPVLVFSPFVVDATVTLARRLVRGERFWQPHREHCYQRLVRMGWGHDRVALAAYAVMAACALSGLWGIQQVAYVQWLMLATWTGVYIWLLWRIDSWWRGWTMRNRDEHE